MKKKILALTAPLLLATTLATEASASTESFNVSTTPPVLVENDLNQNNVMMYGVNPPGKNASVHNISVSSYAYQVEKMGYRLFTDKWIKGKSTVKVSIKNWRVLEDYHDTKKLTVRIYNSSGYVVGSDRC